MVSVPLNQRASGTPAAGAVTLSFPSPKIGRIWLGSVTIPNALGTDVWLVTVGGQLCATVTGSGPFGPLQIQGGQVLALTGTVGLITPYVAVLSGIDDPADNPTAFTGPAALASVSAPSTAPSNVNIVNQPINVDVANSPTVTISGTPTVLQTPVTLAYNSSGAIPAAGGSTNWGTSAQVIYLDTLAIDLAITTAPSAGGLVTVTDYGANPLISLYVPITLTGHVVLSMCWPHRYYINTPAATQPLIVTFPALTAIVGHYACNATGAVSQ